MSSPAPALPSAEMMEVETAITNLINAHWHSAYTTQEYLPGDPARLAANATCESRLEDLRRCIAAFASSRAPAATEARREGAEEVAKLLDGEAASLDNLRRRGAASGVCTVQNTVDLERNIKQLKALATAARTMPLPAPPAARTKYERELTEVIDANYETVVEDERTAEPRASVGSGATQPAGGEATTEDDGRWSKRLIDAARALVRVHDDGDSIDDAERALLDVANTILALDDPGSGIHDEEPTSPPRPAASHAGDRGTVRVTCETCDGTGTMQVLLRVEPPDEKEVYGPESCAECLGRGWLLRRVFPASSPGVGLGEAKP